MCFGIDSAKNILKIARDGGINLFDNAETYGIDTFWPGSPASHNIFFNLSGNPVGEAERIFGQAYSELAKEDPSKWRRSDVLITTKLFWGGDGLNERGLSRKHIMEGMDASLKRLQLEYVDMIFCHRPDSLTPTETVVRAMTDLVRQNKAMAWGTSEWPAQKITEAVWIAKTE
ncbi:MAG: hypothetical protein SGARI_008015, partial [Bacillariaceae sp.]